jgi:cytochrome c-type biogenesis protein
MGLLVDLGLSFWLGLLTPLTAVCVLPLYPAFLAYMANQFGGQKIKDGKISDSSDSKSDSDSSMNNGDNVSSNVEEDISGENGSNGEMEQSSKRNYAMFGLLITLGVIIFMFLLGLIFTTIFQASLTKVVGIISPIAFGILFIISLLLIFDFDFSKYIPRPRTPTSKRPVLNALLYGFFFGAIVIPCNPGFIGAFFARAFLVDSFVGSMLNFVAFGFGLGFPLLLFSLISANYSSKIISWLTARKRWINLIAGVLMLIISIYYLVFVFNVFGIRELIGF